MALNIQVNADYKITSDERNIIVNRRFIVDPTKAPNWAKREADGADPTPKEKWKEVAYCSTVDRALQKIAEQQVRDSDATDLRQVIEEMKRFNREISELIYE